VRLHARRPSRSPRRCPTRGGGPARGSYRFSAARERAEPARGGARRRGSPAAWRGCACWAGLGHAAPVRRAAARRLGWPSGLAQRRGAPLRHGSRLRAHCA
jgi:hypothetical protein